MARQSPMLFAVQLSRNTALLLLQPTTFCPSYPFSAINYKLLGLQLYIYHKSERFSPKHGSVLLYFT